MMLFLLSYSRTCEIRFIAESLRRSCLVSCIAAKVNQHFAVQRTGRIYGPVTSCLLSLPATILQEPLRVLTSQGTLWLNELGYESSRALYSYDWLGKPARIGSPMDP